MPTAIRSLSFNERLYLAAEAIVPPFALVYLIRGEGPLDAASVRACLPAWVAAFPALALRRRGRRWYPGGPLPALAVHQVPLPTDPDHPCVRVGWGPAMAALDLFADGFMLRVRHRAMDAKGLQTALHGLFALLRGEALPAESFFPVDSQLRAALAPSSLPRREGYAFRWGSLKGGHPSDWQTLLWHMDSPPPTPLAAAGSWLAAHLEQPCRFLVPVDLRRHAAVPAAAANLSLPIYLPVEPGTSPAAVQARLLKALADQAELAPDPAERWAPLLPQGLLHATLRLALGQAQRRRRFPMSGFLSDNGFFSLRPLHAPGFRATDAVALPVYVPLAPFCLVALQHEGGTRLALQVPAGLDPAPLREGLAAAWAAGEAPACPSAGLVSDPLVGALRPFWARYLERPEADLAAGLSFVQLGGDSLQLLSLVAEVAPQFVPEQTTIFIEAVLNTGGRLSLADMAGMIHDVNASPP